MFAPTFDLGDESMKQESKKGAAFSGAAPPSTLTKQNTSFWKRPGPGLRRQATSAKLGELVSKSFARRAKAARSTFSFKKGGTLSSLFGSGAKGKGKGKGKSASVLGSSAKRSNGMGNAQQMSPLALLGLKKELLERAVARENAAVDQCVHEAPLRPAASRLSQLSSPPLRCVPLRVPLRVPSLSPLLVLRACPAQLARRDARRQDQ